MMGFGFLLLLLVGVGLAVVLLGDRGLLSRGSQAGGSFNNANHQTAREILDERLARGDIDINEYETLRTRIQE